MIPHHAKRPMVCRRGWPSLLVRGSLCCLSICNSSAAVVCVFCLLFDLNYTLHLPACLHVHPAYLPACLPTCPSRLPAWLTLYLCTCCVGLCLGTFVGVACLACHLNHTFICIWLRSSEDDRAFLLACLPHCLPVRLPLYLCRFCRTFRCWHVPPAGYGCMHCCRAAGPTSGKAASQSGRHQHCRAQGLQQ